MESSDSADHQAVFTDSVLWKLLDRHGNTIRLFVSLPEQSPGSLANRTSCPKASADSEDSFDGAKGSRKSVEAILEESTEKLKNLSLQQQQQQHQQQSSSTSDSQKSSEHSDFELIESPAQEPDAASQPSQTENCTRAASDTENQFPSEERSDSDVNNDRSTSSVDSDILSSSHSSDTLCNADSGPLPLANGLDSHSITSSRRSKAHEGKKETWDTAEEDSGTDSEYDENGKIKADAQYLYFKTEPYSHEDGSGEGQKCNISLINYCDLI